MQFIIILLGFLMLIPSLLKKAEQRKAETARPNHQPERTAVPERPVQSNPTPPRRLPVEREYATGLEQPYESHEGLCEMHPSKVTSSLVFYDEQTPEQAGASKAPVVVPGLGLTFDAPALVRGVVFTEILSRRADRRRK